MPHYIDDDLDDIIVEALKLYAAFKFYPPNDKSQRAREFADALQNDTWLLQTATPPA